MSHFMPEPVEFKHKNLMRDYNELMMRIKAHLFEFSDGKTSDVISPNDFPKPTVEEIDLIQNQVFSILQESRTSLKKSDGGIKN